MFIHRGDSFGSSGSGTTSNRKSRVPDIIIRDDDVGYAPLPCIQVTQVLDGENLDFGYLKGPGPSIAAARRLSEGGAIDGSTSSQLKPKAPGRTSRRVSLIPGEALEQAHAVLEREQSRRGSSQISVSFPIRQNESSHSLVAADCDSRDSPFMHHQYIPLPRDGDDNDPNYQEERKQRGSVSGDRGRLRDTGLSTEDGEGSTASPLSTGPSEPKDVSRPKLNRGRSEQEWANLRVAVAWYAKLRRIRRMKSNQRWMKLRTTVQLSGALSSSMNRAKPPLKREDSFIKRFSTRQIAELHDDTVDHTDEEEVNRTSTGSPKPRRKNRPRTVLTVINPYENVYFYWLCMLTICVLYNFWTAIVRQAFPELQSRARLLWYLLDGFTDLTYLVDILVQLRTGYLEQGLIVYDTKKLARHYLKSRNFLLDLFALIPLDLIQILIGSNPMIRFPRYIKVYRVYNYYYMVESRTLYPNLWRVLNLVHILLLLAHWFGCFYYMLSEAEEFQGDWTYPYTYGAEFKTLTRKYLGSVYWSTLTLTTIGDLPTPESDKQYIFTIVSYLIGVFVFATIVGQVGNVITNRNANRLEFERLLDGAKLYMRHHKVPREMQRRVQRWYDYSWSRGRIQGGGDINSALGLLPDKLRTELALHVNLSTLKKVSIFKECQPEFLHDLVLKMKAYIFTPGDLICRKGEVAREMFIIADGILEVISETGKVLTTMKAGDFFGEIGILNLDGLNKRTADVRSVGYSELFSLSREDVLTAMKDYPEAQEILQSLGRKRLMDARHNKSSSTSSSKRGSLSPNPDQNVEGPNAKRIVSRIRSDVSAIRNAFRRSKGMTRDLETMELEPLTIDSKDDDGPSVKRILKLPRQMTLAAKRSAFRKLGRTAGSGSSDTSGSTVRGVLKRMSRVTSDEAQHVAPATKTEEHVPLGSGFPLLQKLRIWTEKEDKSEEKKSEEEKKSPVHKSVSQNVSRNSSEDKEIEVIGEGLPLFARLRLLKLKQDRERMEQEEAERKKKEEDKNSQSSEHHKVPATSQDYVKDSTVQDQKTNSSDSLVPSSDKKEPPVKGLLKIKLKSALQKRDIPSNGKPTEIVPINDLNKGTDEKTNSTQVHGNNNTIIPKLNDGNSKVQGNNGKHVQKTHIKKSNTSNSSDSSLPFLTVESPNNDMESENNSEKVQRRDSFKKAMEDGRMAHSEDTDLNITKSADSSGEENKLEKNIPSRRNSKKGSPLKSEHQDELNLKEACNVKNTDKSVVPAKPKINERPPPRVVKVIKKPDNCRQQHLVNNNRSTLKVPSDEVSPPLSSPESTETPERKSLKSILKSISRDDSACTLLPEGADLRRLMLAPTVQGFVARRSKFVKSVSFQRRTLRSPPSSFKDYYNSNSTLPHSISSENQRSLSQSSLSSSVSNQLPSIKKPTEFIQPRDGVQSLLRKLGSIGVDTTSSYQTEDLVRGVRKIFRDKIEDVEFAWETRIEALQQEVAIRDETIRQLTDTINQLQVVLCGTSDESSLSESENLTDDLQAEDISTAQVNESSNSDEDEDEPAFMRCGSIESIIHQSPEISPPPSEHATLSSRRSWPRSTVQRQSSLSQQRMARSWDFQDIPRLKGKDVVIDIGTSSTDDDIYSISSDDDRVIFDRNDSQNDDQDVIGEVLEDELNMVDDEINDETLDPPNQLTDQQLNSQDWEVQMLAQQLAEEQRGVARKIDRDIACGRLQSPLADLHEALATDNLSNLKECDLLRLEKIVRKEREKLRQYARMYSLDERPVLEDEFTSLYRSRSQLLLSRSSELCRADSTDRRLLKLLSQLTSLPASEQFLLDRLVYKSAKNRKMSRQQSLCDERLSSYNQRSMRLHVNSNTAIRRSVSMCSPPPESSHIVRQASSSVDHTVHPITSLPESTSGETEVEERRPQSTMSSMLARLQRSFSISDSEASHRSDTSRNPSHSNKKNSR